MQRFRSMGIKPENIFIDDLREEFVRDFVFPMFRCNTVYEGEYLLGTSIARPLIAKRLAKGEILTRYYARDTQTFGKQFDDKILRRGRGELCIKIEYQHRIGACLGKKALALL